MYQSVKLSGLIMVLVASTSAVAAEPVTLATVEKTSANTAAEPIAAEFSLERVTRFLDSAALNWQTQRKCMTCHTNYAYLYARPSISSDAPAHRSVRQFAEQLVTERWQTKGPRWDAEVVATAAALAFNDAAVTNKLHDVTRAALDRMWTVQQADGGWNWLKCGWPPMESDDHYGVTLAAIAVGVAPDNYADTDQAKQGLAKIREYLKANPPPTLHHQAMMLWADSYVGALLTEHEKRVWVSELLRLQNADGGWALAALGDWKRADGSMQDTETSDGYATGLVIYVLRRAGIAAERPEIQSGVRWLKSNQRESGRWFTRSLHSDSRHYISHAGTAMAVMALSQCDQLK